MSPGATVGRGAQLGFPRVSGDEPVHALPVVVVEEFSPRERG